MAEALPLTTEMMVVLGVLAFAVILFVSEMVRVDVAAILIMTLLGLFTLVPGLDHIISAQDLFGGFASNAVISIIAVMIIGAALDKTGVVAKLASLILNYGGGAEKRVMPLLCAAVSAISSFMQNVGAAALFIPVVSRISARSGLPMSRLLMPMGFCAILGGTMTMVGSSPLILLNDLIRTSNESLPEAQKMTGFDLFSVTPVGLALVATGILYFMVSARFVLPHNVTEGAEATSTMDYYKGTYGLDYELFEGEVPAGSPLVGETVRDIERGYQTRLIGTRMGDDLRIEPAGGLEIQAGTVVAMLMHPGQVDRLTEANGLVMKPVLKDFAESLLPIKAGICEVVVPPNSRLIGRDVRELAMRDRYGLAVLAVHRAGETLDQGIRDLPFQSGDALVCHTTWDNLFRLEKDRNFVVVTTEYPREETRPEKVGIALLFFALALGLILFSDLRLSIALMVGAIGMVVSGVLSMDEAYDAVSWQTVFLLASLIPLGQAVEATGTATWIAQQVLSLLGAAPLWVLQAVIALLATGFTLVMSHVGATVLLVPLAVNIALGAGADPAIFALTVAIATSNSFLIPTHQVNALIMGPGGYRVKDFMWAGSLMTLLFLLVGLTAMNTLL